ncbi:MAG: nucleotidyl transferase AbiEii/AbiGii toxin family protein [Longimicrobiaceae bacterium]
MVGPLQLRLLRIVADVNQIYPVPDLRLKGGTALSAYHLVHRESRDLDLFAAPSLNASEFGELVREEAEREGVQMSAVGPASLGYATYLAKLRDAAVRLDFAAASSYRLDSFDETAEGVRIASYADLCAGKLHAICDRFAERYFVDLLVPAG